jgi:hypothetical protein
MHAWHEFLCRTNDSTSGSIHKDCSRSPARRGRRARAPESVSCHFLSSTIPSSQVGIFLSPPDTFQRSLFLVPENYRYFRFLTGRPSWPWCDQNSIHSVRSAFLFPVQNPLLRIPRPGVSSFRIADCVHVDVASPSPADH